MDCFERERMKERKMICDFVAYKYTHHKMRPVVQTGQQAARDIIRTLLSMMFV